MHTRPLQALVIVAIIATGCVHHTSSDPLPLRPVGEIPLPGDSSRFDYASLDAQRGLLFVAHLGASEVIEIDLHVGRVVRRMPNLSQVHGV
jgi:hypothetical protein